MRRLAPVICVFAVLVLAASQGQATPITGPIVNPANGHEYWLLPAASWTDSLAAARALTGSGGENVDLVLIGDPDENDWVYNTFTPIALSAGGSGDEGNLWIGLTDDPSAVPGASEGNFVWSNGIPAPYRKWVAGQPDNGSGPGVPEHYVVLNGPGTTAPLFWNDCTNAGTCAANDYTVPFAVAETVPEPGTALMLGLSLLGLAGFRPVILR